MGNHVLGVQWYHHIWPWVTLKGQSHWDFRPYLERERVSHTLLLNINRNPYMGSPVVVWYLILSDLQRPNSSSLRFQSLISHKGVELGYMFLLILIGNHGESNDIVIFDLEWPWKILVNVTLILKAYILKRSRVKPYVIINANMIPHMRSPMAPSHLTLGDLERATQIFRVVRDLYIVVSILIWIWQKGIYERVGFSTVPPLFLVLFDLFVFVLYLFLTRTNCPLP